jgi:hypothetical protein
LALRVPLGCNPPTKAKKCIFSPADATIESAIAISINTKLVWKLILGREPTTCQILLNLGPHSQTNQTGPPGLPCPPNKQAYHNRQPQGHQTHYNVNKCLHKCWFSEDMIYISTPDGSIANTQLSNSTLPAPHWKISNLKSQMSGFVRRLSIDHHNTS